MCGIFGEYLFRGEIELGRYLKKLNAIKHRGPDGFGFEYGNFNEGEYTLCHNNLTTENNKSSSFQTNYFYGHRRLSILDLNENAFQPMETIDRRYSIVFNGEIYNHIELKKKLVSLGAVFKTDHSDTEVLLNAYFKWGVECLKHLRGMFAFAIFDRTDHTIFLARDRIGQKSLYYEFSDEKFTFSSEIGPMIKFSSSPRVINLTALSYYMAFGYVPQPISIFEGINKLPPASYAQVDLKENNLTIERYWDVDFSKKNEERAESFTSEVDKQLSDSVSMRLRADVPVGAFISGGIDSTLIVKKIKEIGKRKFDIFGADFPQIEQSERRYMEEVALKYEQNLQVSYIDLLHVKNINDIINVFDEPFDGGSSIALFDLFKKARQKYKVILTGDGGDEVFSGYTRYLSTPILQQKIELLKNLYFPRKILLLLSKLGIKSKKAKKLSQLIDGDLLSNYLLLNNELELAAIVRNQKNHFPDQFEFFSELRSKIKRLNLSPVKALQYFEMNTILPGRMLYKLDRVSMYHGVEARSPILDHQLIEKAFQIPDNINIKNGKTKWILKNILEADFGPDFIDRKKQGFGNPLSHWFKHSNKEDVFKTLIDENSFVFNYLDYRKLHDCLPQIKNGFDGTEEKILWRLLVIGQYMENHKEYIAC